MELKAGGNTIVKKELKYIHFNPACGLSSKEKNNIVNVLNGFKRRNEAIAKIIKAKDELNKQALST